MELEIYLKEKEMTTHNLIVKFGKHKGERWTRLPISYLKWLINEETQYSDIAEAELKRRGTILDHEIDISGHAVDRASINCMNHWRKTRKRNEGLYSWLMRMSKAAIKQDGKKEKIVYKGVTFVFCYGKLYPTLKTIIVKG